MRSNVREAEDLNQGVLVKLKGSKQGILSVKEAIEDRFYAMPTSMLRPNDDGRGFHIFLVILGVREK